jgi:NhaA family Na+:H+ antiporter
MSNQSNTDLPKEIADRITRPFARFLKIKAAAGALLFSVTPSALVLVNLHFSPR